ncbi:hypothetical protein ASPZODRAFT_115976 [Penicilliopsis zonata CBS 506.65]|uniref:Uncharacterized protein n=1 Tax=Penicilliopsis zonata CBS 506.65 TaxID=1073090 RepID=A0A1L9SIY7_9EURO|nr:hypothetical protein ASPZODRAFT_115976 [Penicilliopsis zonata CBS 506.65]OJJ47053.1 hypothetical protein ASPZODRAFT_115976 [Penicilliopsis zonata CBS 506.65]
MAADSVSVHPTTLDAMFDLSSPSREQYDPVRLTSAQALAVLQLSLAKEVFGHNDAEQSALGQVSSKDVSYTAFVTEKVKAVFLAQTDDLTVEAKRSQLLHIGLAALFSFLQSNVTGPPLEFSPAETVLPPVLRTTASALRGIRDQVIRELSVDGEAAYKLTPNVELFSVAKAILVDADVLVQDNSPLLARVARMRVNFLHQKMLSEVTTTLQDAIYVDLDVLAKTMLPSQSPSTTEEKGRFLLERATIHTHHGFDAKARADLERAAAVKGFEFALTGRLGKRTKFQERDVSQLVVLAQSAESPPKETTESQSQESSGPKKLDLNDDTLLEAISFTKEDSQNTKEKSVTVQEESSLPSALASLDPGNQPLLDPVDSAILLALASAITNTSPEHGLTREETLPYATRVLEGGSSNWQIYTQALLVRSRVEGFRSRTVERSVLQMQALVDQVIADTATLDTEVDASKDEQPTTFLPRPEKSESAPADQRLEYIWLLNFSTRWSLEAELAQRWVDLGGLRTALEIYERLHMWAEVALCYAATEREDKARSLVRRQLYEPTNKDEENDDDTYEGPELALLPANAPRLFCILGDIDKDPALYERAWDVSKNRYARAQRSLARHWLMTKPPQPEKAEEAYLKSLHINRLNHGAWFALGCVQLELQKWEEAIQSFTRTVQLEDTDAEAWSNLAAAMLRVSESEPSETAATTEPTPSSADDDEQQPDEGTEEPKEEPYKRKREALAALQRAAQIKHSDSRIWDNLLTVAASIPPPYTPLREIVNAQRRVIEIVGAKKGEKCIDLRILGMLVDHLVTNYEYENLLIPMETETGDGSTTRILRSGTTPGQIISLLDDRVVPLITHSAPLWLLVGRVELFRGRPSKALEAHEKAWRAVVASSTQGAFQMGEEKKWTEIVAATERLVRNGYAKYGPMEKESQDGGHPGSVAEGEAELVAKDWRFKARSAVRGIMGKGKEFWEDSDGWARLKALQSEVSGGQ